MSPSALKNYLTKLVEQQLSLSAMIWGPPGIGKSSIVRQIAEDHQLEFVDLRLSQLAPTDLRGLPVPQEGITRWAPPEFLPQSGRGILFLDEINMAPPALQGVAQQLILDRAVGSYRVPDGWFIWAAGNRKEDKASVYDMPAPLANRFIHLDVEPELADFRAYGYRSNLHELVLGFLSFRPDLLHKIIPHERAWPSPRSWEMASQLFNAGLKIAPEVGPVAAEFNAYVAIMRDLPDLDAITEGKSQPAFPTETSLKYAVVTGLVRRCTTAAKALPALSWLAEHATAEWVQLFATDLFPLLREKKQLPALQKQILANEQLRSFLNDYTRLLMG